MNKPICKRCLLRELQNADNEKKIINDYKKATLPEEIVSKNIYEQRLALCKECKFLNMGVCLKNGGYVEAFCYRLEYKCPAKLF